MKVIAQIKLQPTPTQAEQLRSTLERANAACSDISRVAWEQQTFGKYALQELVYHRIKSEYGLTAQMVIRCIAKVGDSYKREHTTCRDYAYRGSIAYDDRILLYRSDQRYVSIWTLAGRERIPFVCGERQSQLLQTRQGESDLVYRAGEFYLLATCNVDEPTPDEVDAALGVDLGIVNLATDSDGQTFMGAAIERTRQRCQARRDALQQVGTRSAKRRLKTNSRRQRRFQSNTNHVISKQLVQKAKDTQRVIVLEELTHIRSRTTVRKSGRARHSNWAFGQLRAFLSYKAALCGVSIQMINPAYTSKTCSRCGCCDDRNRKSQSAFHCVSCSYAANADYNAACNIRDWAVVIPPMVSRTQPVSSPQKQAAAL